MTAGVVLPLSFLCFHLVSVYSRMCAPMFSLFFFVHAFPSGTSPWPRPSAPFTFPPWLSIPSFLSLHPSVLPSLSLPFSLLTSTLSPGDDVLPRPEVIIFLQSSLSLSFSPFCSHASPAGSPFCSLLPRLPLLPSSLPLSLGPLLPSLRTTTCCVKFHYALTTPTLYCIYKCPHLHPHSYCSRVAAILLFTYSVSTAMHTISRTLIAGEYIHFYTSHRLLYTNHSCMHCTVRTRTPPSPV